MEKIICLFHDIERGLGHRDVDPEFAARADRFADDCLNEMLAVEDALQVKLTYNVVGCLLSQVAERISQGGHCLAFHSYDHTIEDIGDLPPGGRLFQKLTNRWMACAPTGQLARCRQLNPEIKGYRAPQSKMTPELTDRNLRRHGFEWFACSMHLLGIKRPELQKGIVKIPIACDDFPLYSVKQEYPQWEAEVLARCGAKSFTALGLHDCYAEYWLPHYRSLLSKLKGLGELRTFDEVADPIRSRNHG